MWLDLYTACGSFLEARRTAFTPFAEVRRPWHPGARGVGRACFPLAPQLTNRQHHVFSLVPDAVDAAGVVRFPLASAGCV